MRIKQCYQWVQFILQNKLNYSTKQLHIIEKYLAIKNKTKQECSF